MFVLMQKLVLSIYSGFPSKTDMWVCFNTKTFFPVCYISRGNAASIIGTLGPLRKLEDFFDIISYREEKLGY